MYSHLKIGFLGLGKMGHAIASGLLSNNPELKLFAFDSSPAIQERLKSEPRLVALERAIELEEKCDLILLCVKPQEMGRALQGFQGQKMYISIAAGLGIEKIGAALGSPASLRVARVMPNISATVGRAVSGVYCREPELLEVTLAIFNSVGHAVVVEDEELMHGVTALSGSGPAYVFSFIEGLIRGGVECGLERKAAHELAVHTLLGAAKMCLDGETDLEELIARVASKGGTTEAGLKVLAETSFRESIQQAVQSAAKRSRELGD